MKSLYGFLKNKGYSRVPLRLTETNHFEITAKINGVEGRFILDTGASSTCVGFDDMELFKLLVEDSNVKASGAGATDMRTQVSKKNVLEIGFWKRERIGIILFDLTHVNTALEQYNVLPVQGIIGADILKKGKAVIDYNRKYVYLK